MATIKSYTDLKQSKKLVEILPLESADMEYILEQWIDEKTHRHKEGYYEIPVVKVDDDCPLQPITLPCWSLATLLELLPKRIEIVDNVYELSIYLYGIYYWNTINGNLCFESKDKDNLVDACYEAIVFFHEQKLL